MNLTNDLDFIKKLKSGHSQALNHLFTQYRSWLTICAYTVLRDEVEAEEIVQEFFIDFWENKKFRLIEAKSIPALKNYLFICIKNRCLNQIAKNKTRQSRYADLLLPKDYILPENRLEIIELKNNLKGAISQLTNRQREVFELGYIAGKTRKQISTELCISQETVKKLMANALKTLRRILNKTETL